MKFSPTACMLWAALAVTLAAVGCGNTAHGATYGTGEADALYIVTCASMSDTAPAPVTPDTKVPRAQCKECNGTGTITHGDGHKTACSHCYVLYRRHQHPSIGELQDATGATGWGWSGVGDGFVAVKGPVSRHGTIYKDLEAEKKRAFFRDSAPASDAKVCSCPCGADCQCENCPEDCLGELVRLDEKSIAPAFVPQPSLQLVANRSAATKPSSNCANGRCELTPSTSGSDCTTNCGAGSGSCGSGSCSSGHAHGGPVRRVVAHARPVRRVAGLFREHKPVRRLFGGIFRGGCCR